MENEYESGSDNEFWDMYENSPLKDTNKDQVSNPKSRNSRVASRRRTKRVITPNKDRRKLEAMNQVRFEQIVESVNKPLDKKASPSKTQRNALRAFSLATPNIHNQVENNDNSKDLLELKRIIAQRDTQINVLKKQLSKQEYMLTKFRLISEFQSTRKAGREDLERRVNLLSRHNETLRKHNTQIKLENTVFSEFFTEAQNKIDSYEIIMEEQKTKIEKLEAELKIATEDFTKQFGKTIAKKEQEMTKIRQEFGMYRQETELELNLKEKINQRRTDLIEGLQSELKTTKDVLMNKRMKAKLESSIPQDSQRSLFNSQIIRSKLKTKSHQKYSDRGNIKWKPGHNRQFSNNPENSSSYLHSDYSRRVNQSYSPTAMLQGPLHAPLEHRGGKKLPHIRDIRKSSHTPLLNY